MTEVITLEIIVPVYQGRDWIESCFSTLAAQTLNRSLFHVTFVFNGEDDGGHGVLRSLLEDTPGFPARTVSSSRKGAASARNLGLVESAATHVTWVDVDDQLSAEYVELLYREIRPGVIPTAMLVDVEMNGTISAEGVIAKDFLKQEKPLCSPKEVPRLMTYMVGKVVPADWVRRNPLPESLDSGEDVAFYSALLLQNDFLISLWPGVSGAIYFRRIVPGSVSRQEPSRDFMVRQRCDVIEYLSIALDDARVPENESVVSGYINSQASFVRRYIEANPSTRQSVMDEITARQIRRFPWRITTGTPNDLVVAYNFAPYTDTGATIVSKRIREMGRSVDVISNQMGATRESLTENMLLAAPYIARHHQLPGAPSFAHPNGVKDFVDRGMLIYEELLQSGRSYQRMYSRSMWPASHFLAAKIKAANPSILWTAEFSDPVRLTTEGSYRHAGIIGTALHESFADLTSMEGMELLQQEPDLYNWTELLPYLMADRLVFTNHHQIATMLDYAPEALKELVRSKATISRHPTLPREFYGIGDAKLPPIAKINIGYFGDFYSTRGLQEVLSALRSLTWDEQNSIALSVFTSKASEDLVDSQAGDLSHVLRSGPRVSFLDFLATLDTFDVLIVNDADTVDRHVRNPYLPSKLSDYRGSKAKIWAIAEPESSLAAFPANFTSVRGDSDGARRVLLDIINGRMSSAVLTEAD